MKRISSLPVSQSPREMSEDRESTPRRWKERTGREKEAGGSSVFIPGQSSSREVSEDRESTPASSSAPSKTPEPWQEETEEVVSQLLCSNKLGPEEHTICCGIPVLV